jgi:hypothetical protein
VSGAGLPKLRALKIRARIAASAKMNMWMAKGVSTALAPMVMAKRARRPHRAIITMEPPPEGEPF